MTSPIPLLKLAGHTVTLVNLKAQPTAHLMQPYHDFPNSTTPTLSIYTELILKPQPLPQLELKW